jgi:hypothetical protein
LTAIAIRKPAAEPAAEITDAARQLGRRGGRPRGSYSSPLAAWLRREVAVKQREGWSRREGFEIARDTHSADGQDGFTLAEWVTDEWDRDYPARVTWANWKKIWSELANVNRFP